MTHSNDNAAAAAATDRQRAYAYLRVTMGVNIFLHGATRIAAGVGPFADKMAGQFANTPMPPRLTHAFLVTLPFLEATVGLLLVLGLFTRLAVLAGGLLITTLVFGTALQGDWSALGIQMLYALAYYVLIAHATHDAYGLDRWRRGWTPSSRREP